MLGGVFVGVIHVLNSQGNIH